MATRLPARRALAPPLARGRQAPPPTGVGYDLTRPQVVWLHDLSWALLLGGLMMYLGLSADALRELGWPYATPYGNPAFKVHPGTYAIVIAYVLGLTSFGNPLRIAALQWSRQPWLLVALLCNVFIFVWGVWRHGLSGAAFVIETLWMPPLCLAAMMLQPVARQRLVLYALSIMLVVNAAIALGEFAVKKTVINPHDEKDVGWVPDVYFRSRALLGHPLNNALLTITLLPAVTQLLPIPVVLRVGLFLMLHLALLSFGGRAAFVMTCLINVSFSIFVGMRAFIRGRYTYVQVLATLLTVVLLSAALIGLVLGSGLGARIFETQLSNDSSAKVRLTIWGVFEYLDAAGLVFGVSPARIEEISRQIGLDLRYEAIENYWIGMQMQMGLIGFIPFVIGLAALTVHIWRISTGWQRLGVIAFFIVGSGGNTLTSKTSVLSLLACSIQAGLAMRAWWLTQRGLPLTTAALRAGQGEDEIHAAAPHRIARQHDGAAPNGLPA